MQRKKNRYINTLFTLTYCVAIAVFSSVITGEEANSAVGGIVFEPCSVSGPAEQINRKAECASYAVALDPQTPNGEKISLYIVRLPSRVATDNPDPLLMIAGGPGQAASETYLFADRSYEKVHRHRDIYLIDQRGTGKSAKLECDILANETFDQGYDEKRYREIAQVCLAELTLDPRFFTTGVAIADLEAIRKALGINQWNLFGVSYGTRVALHYLRKHPEAIRSAVLDGVVFPELILGPSVAIESQRALERLLTRCEQQVTCAQAFPKLRHELNGLIESLKKAGREVSYENINTGEQESIHFSAAHLAIVLRLSLYQDELMALLPPMLHQAYAKGNFSPLARAANLITKKLTDVIGGPMHNSVMCAEDIAFYESDEDDLKMQQQTYMGDELLRAAAAVCDIWPRGPVDDDFKLPLSTSIPIVMFSGSEDPITPPAYAEKVIKHLSNAMHFELNGQGHGVSAIGCAPTIMAKFIDAASVENLNGDCLSKLEPAPFFLDFNGPSP